MKKQILRRPFDLAEKWTKTSKASLSFLYRTAALFTEFQKFQKTKFHNAYENVHSNVSVVIWSASG